mgnify:CR=1 FL=1
MKMRQTLIVAVAILAAAGMTGFINTLYGQGGAAAKPVSVAVVDIQSVFNNLEERTKLEARIQDRIAGLQEWEQEKKKEISRLRNDLEIVSKDSPNYKKTRDKLRDAVIELQVKMQVAQREVEQEKAIQLERLYKKVIDNGIEPIAKQAGFDVVLLKDEMPNLTGANQQQIAAVIQVRKLLYADDALDITDRVKQRMNNAFANDGGDG